MDDNYGLLPYAHHDSRDTGDFPFSTQSTELSQSKKRDLTATSDSLYYNDDHEGYAPSRKKLHQFTSDADETYFNASIPSSPYLYADNVNTNSDGLGDVRYSDDPHNFHLEKLPAHTIIQRAIEDGNEKIELSGYDLVDVPTEIADLGLMIHLGNEDRSFTPKIQLYLSNNRLTGLPSFLFDVLNITALSLRNNALNGIPTGVAKLTNLVDISVGGNRLKYLPSELLELESLQVLSAYPNNFPRRPDDANYEECPPTLTQTTTSPLSQNKKAVVKEKIRTFAIEHIQRYYKDDRNCTPSLVELCLQKISQLRVEISGYDREFKKHQIILPVELSNKIDESYEAFRNIQSCGVCKRPIMTTNTGVSIIGHVLEWWNVCGQQDLVFRRNVCTFNCLEKWRDEYKSETNYEAKPRM